MREPDEASSKSDVAAQAEPRLLTQSEQKRADSDAPSPMSSPATNGVSTPSDALTAMLDCLKGYLPSNTDGLPENVVSVSSLNERPVGLGNFRGEERVDNFMLVALKGGRLDAKVRFQLWAATATQTETLGFALQEAILNDKENLRGDGFLRVDLIQSSVSESNVPLNASSKTLEFAILYEYAYRDSDGAESLISSIPVETDPEERNSPVRELFTVTGDMTRWDEDRAPSLRLRGNRLIHELTMLIYRPSAAPTASVRLRRTFDGATGPAASFATFDAFLDAVTDSELPARHAEWVFASFSDFLAHFINSGESIELGDWDEDLTIDSYELLSWMLPLAIPLPNNADRFEITYAPGDSAPKFDQTAVLYLRNRDIL